MTKNQITAMEITREAILERGRGSVTASYVAQRAGEPFATRKWSGVLSSLANQGHLTGLADGFVQRTFYVLP